MAEEPGVIVPGRKIGARTLHPLMNDIQFDYLSRWLGRSMIQTTGISFLEVVPDSWESLDWVP